MVFKTIHCFTNSYASILYKLYYKNVTDQKNEKDIFIGEMINKAIFNWETSGKSFINKIMMRHLGGSVG